jgi:glycine cleavage system T protein
MKRSALHDLHVRRGGRFAEVAGWEMVADYGDAEAEHRSVRTGAGLIDLSHRGKLRLTGRDRVSFLHGMITHDVKGLKEGEGRYAALLTAQGQTLADLRVYCRPDHLLLDVEPGLAEKVCAALSRYLISEDVVIQDVTEGMSLVAVCGPASPEALRSVADVSGLAVYGSASAGDALVVRSDDTGEVGFLLFAPPAQAEGVWAGLCERGARPAGLTAFRALRMEAGVPVYGVDIEEGATPIEASIGHAVSFDKGCYIGQEVIAKMTYRGRPRRHLVGFAVEGDTPPSAGDRVMRDGAEAGHVTSGLRSPSLGRVIAFGYVKRDMNQVGSRVEILSGGRTLSAEIVETPFYKSRIQNTGDRIQNEKH